jgi:diadenosine tetraphosphate (Ap4A) HIT family hydrolase
MPGFRVIVNRTQRVNGGMHYHCHLMARRYNTWALCGVMVLHEEEMDRMRLICEATSIEIKNAISPEATEIPGK